MKPETLAELRAFYKEKTEFVEHVAKHGNEFEKAFGQVIKEAVRAPERTTAPDAQKTIFTTYATTPESVSSD